MVSNRIPHVPARLVVIQILDPPGTPKGDTPKENDSDLDYTILRLSLALARGLLRPGITNQTCLNLNLVLVLTLALALALLGMQCFYSAEDAEGSGTRRFDPVAAVDLVAGVVCSATVEPESDFVPTVSLLHFPQQFPRRQQKDHGRTKLTQHVYGRKG